VATSTSVSGTGVAARCKIKGIGEIDREEAQGPKENLREVESPKKIGEKGRVLKKSERGAHPLQKRQRVGHSGMPHKGDLVRARLGSFSASTLHLWTCLKSK
jgi:hypothetical protein